MQPLHQHQREACVERVGMAGSAPATSRPPAERAAGCATSRDFLTSGPGGNRTRVEPDETFRETRFLVRPLLAASQCIRNPVSRPCRGSPWWEPVPNRFSGGRPSCPTGPLGRECARPRRRFATCRLRLDPASGWCPRRELHPHAVVGRHGALNPACLLVPSPGRRVRVEGFEPPSTGHRPVILPLDDTRERHLPRREESNLAPGGQPGSSPECSEACCGKSGWPALPRRPLGPEPSALLSAPHPEEHVHRVESGRQDSNLHRLGPKPSALPLSHVQMTYTLEATLGVEPSSSLLQNNSLPEPVAVRRGAR